MFGCKFEPTSIRAGVVAQHRMLHTRQARWLASNYRCAPSKYVGQPFQEPCLASGASTIDHVEWMMFVGCIEAGSTRPQADGAAFSRAPAGISPCSR